VKILVIRFSSIGDVIWASPVLRCLKQQLPQAEVHLCTKAAYAEMFEANPYLDKMHLLGKEGLKVLLKQLQAEKFDYVIDLHKNFRSFYLRLHLKAPAYSYRKLSFEKWLLVQFRINRLPQKHTADRYLDTLRPLGVVPDGKGLDYFVPERFQLPADYLPSSHRPGYAAFVIGASYFTKKLPLPKMLELCAAIKQPIVLIGGPEDQANAQALCTAYQAAYPERLPLVNTCGHLSISQSAWLLQQAEVVYGHDTGLTHIAAAFQKKIYSIWGSTVPEMGLFPYKTTSVIIENKELACRPCSRMGKKKCPKGHFACMNSLRFENLP
jgi:heptosyltransferase-2